MDEVGGESLFSKRKLRVGFCACVGKHALYIPLYSRSILGRTKYFVLHAQQVIELDCGIDVATGQDDVIEGFDCEWHFGLVTRTWSQGLGHGDIERQGCDGW